MTVVGAATQYIGLNHRLNEDRYRLLGSAVPLVARADRGCLFAVADGVGGSPLAMRAAQHFVDRLTDFFRVPPERATGPELLALLTTISDEIACWGYFEGSDRPLGAAAGTVAWLTPARSLAIFQAGDTAAYRVTPAGTQRLTRSDVMQGSLRSYYGVAGLRPAVTTHPFDEGDRLCLVSDGVTCVVSTVELGEAVLRGRDVEEAAEIVAKLAKKRGSPDDITALVAEVEAWEE